MDDLIELYLFKHKKCPLPALGILQVMDTHATALYGEGKIDAPIPTIKFLEQELPADDLIRFIASKKNISTNDAAALLNQYCDKLQQMDAFGETKLPHAGKFYVNADGNLVFKTMEMPREFLPEVPAERVIHPDVAHAMVVGDKETTTTEMAAYYSETEAAAKDKWWIWATGLVVIAAALLFFYFNDHSHSSSFGNTQQIEISPSTNTYSIGQ